ncbi:MAG: ribose 5-phosphate isomerase B [Corallococcus sp.]|nr:ribose 5-phosphate isomerase B [Corallococcus sp.]MCM1359390.1 ribose 5-phosphate isomerase B [Corallococcus sp.]MCM1394833.1 ribose 5-phosphate isomerase B [Corallococcus sp.]
MKISLASDHGGLTLKNKIKEYLENKGYQVSDFGTDTADSCDYPDFARPAALAVANGSADRGIVVCTTGIGVSIVANKVKGVRCALCLNEDMAVMTRRHNDANMLAMGQKYVDENVALKIADAFLSTPFDGGRHQNRVDKIEG